VRRFRIASTIVLCSFIGACNQADLMRRWTPPEAESAAKKYVDLLRQGQFDQITRDLDPSLLDSSTHRTLVEMASEFPNGIPESIKVVGLHIRNSNESSTTDISLEYQFPNRWLVAELSTKKAGSRVSIIGFHVTPISESLEDQNRFTLVGKTPFQYCVLALALCSLLFTLYMAVICLRTKNVRRKWLWTLFILTGVEKLAVNWNTGQLTIGILAFQIPCFLASHPLYGPWTIGAFFPLGAVLFLNRRKKIMATSDSMPAQSGSN
jgi:hypothetical protein